MRRRRRRTSVCRAQFLENNLIALTLQRCLITPIFLLISQHLSHGVHRWQLESRMMRRMARPAAGIIEYGEERKNNYS